MLDEDYRMKQRAQKLKREREELLQQGLPESGKEDSLERLWAFFCALCDGEENLEHPHVDLMVLSLDIDAKTVKKEREINSVRISAFPIYGRELYLYSYVFGKDGQVIGRTYIRSEDDCSEQAHETWEEGYAHLLSSIQERLSDIAAWCKIQAKELKKTAPRKKKRKPLSGDEEDDGSLRCL